MNLCLPPLVSLFGAAPQYASSVASTPGRDHLEFPLSGGPSPAGSYHRGMIFTPHGSSHKAAVGQRRLSLSSSSFCGGAGGMTIPRQEYDPRALGAAPRSGVHSVDSCSLEGGSIQGEFAPHLGKAGQPLLLDEMDSDLRISVQRGKENVCLVSYCAHICTCAFFARSITWAALSSFSGVFGFPLFGGWPARVGSCTPLLFTPREARAPASCALVMCDLSTSCSLVSPVGTGDISLRRSVPHDPSGYTVHHILGL